MLEDRRSGLTVADPVSGDRCPVGEEFLDHDEAIERSASVAAVFLRPGKPEEPGRAELGREGRIVLGQPGVAAWNKSAVGDLLFKERPDFGAELLGRCRQGSRRKRKTSHDAQSADNPPLPANLGERLPPYVGAEHLR